MKTFDLWGHLADLAAASAASVLARRQQHSSLSAQSPWTQTQVGSDSTEKNNENLKTGNEAQLIVRSVPSVSVVSVAIAERSLIYFARVAGQGLRSISIAGRRKSKSQLRSPHTHGPAHGCKSVGACAYGEMLRRQSWILVLERRSGTCSCGWKLLILTLVILFFRLSRFPL